MDDGLRLARLGRRYGYGSHHRGARGRAFEAGTPVLVAADIKGHFDHFGVDVEGKRLFGTAVEDRKVVVFDFGRYAVSIVKAGMKLIGRDCGPVRSQLTDLTRQEMDELAVLVAGRK